jgi:putative FmdB family regulatory protein
MPIYEFVCEKCNYPFEYLVLSARDRPAECPQCHGKKLKKLMSAGNVRPKGIPSGSGGFVPPKCAPAGT